MMSSAGRAIYHILDNVGIPLPYKNTADLDPSIAVPPPELSVEVKRLERVNPPSDQSSTENVPQFPQSFQPTAQKIPASELEGVELPTPRDVPKDNK
jgi:hypothetical protein